MRTSGANERHIPAPGFDEFMSKGEISTDINVSPREPKGAFLHLYWHFNLQSTNYTRYERQVRNVHIAAYFLDPANAAQQPDQYNQKRVFNSFAKVTRSPEEAKDTEADFALFKLGHTPFARPAAHFEGVPCLRHVH